MSIITPNIEYIRKRSGFSRIEIAKLLEISVEEYTAIETGEKWPSMDVLAKISHICDTTTDELIGFQPKDEESAKEVLKKIAELNGVEYK